MKWIAISGSWRKFNKQVEKDVRSQVIKILKSGDGIITGGALGVDYFATDEVLKHDPSKIKVYLPSSLELYEKHYFQRAKEGIITKELAEQLISQLKKLKNLNPKGLIEDFKYKIVNKESYYNRISKIIKASDELIAFQVNKSEGTQDTINKAKQKGIPVKIFRYTIS